MPGKLRAPKPRYDAKAEFDAWEMTFESGCDFFRETGCVLPLDVWPPEDRPPFERAFRAAAHARRGFASARCSYRSATPMLRTASHRGR